MAHVQDDVPPMRAMYPEIVISAQMEDTVMRCLAKNPAERFASMDDVLTCLKRLGPSASQSLELRALDASGSVPRARVQSFTSVGSMPAAGAQYPSQTPPAMASIPPPAPAPTATIAALGAVLGLVMAGGVYLALRKPPVPKPVVVASAVAPQPPPPTIPVSALPTAEPMPPPLAKVRINSEPDGATVKEDGVEICTSTPCDILYKDADADPAAIHTLVVSRAGYRAETRMVKASDSPVTFKLARAGGGAPRATKPAQDDTTPKGFKDIPY